MKIIKKLPPVRISAVILLTAMITAAATFGGTYSWFLTEATVSVSGIMGTVDIALSGDTIENSSTIPIIVRVRVIAEWRAADNGVTGVPPGDIDISALNITGSTDWELKDSFLVYTGENKLQVTDENGESVNTVYGIIGAEEDIPALPQITPPIDSASNWKAEITFIAEALQATQKAYEYTMQPDSGVPSWEIKND